MSLDEECHPLWGATAVMTVAFCVLLWYEFYAKPRRPLTLEEIQRAKQQHDEARQKRLARVPEDFAKSSGKRPPKPKVKSKIKIKLPPPTRFAPKIVETSKAKSQTYREPSQPLGTDVRTSTNASSDVGVGVPLDVVPAEVPESGAADQIPQQQEPVTPFIPFPSDASPHNPERVKETTKETSTSEPASPAKAVTGHVEEESSFIHGHHACNSCSMVPIIGKRFRAQNISDYDLCEKCHSNYSGTEIQFETVELERDRSLQEHYRRWLHEQKAALESVANDDVDEDDEQSTFLQQAVLASLSLTHNSNDSDNGGRLMDARTSSPNTNVGFHHIPNLPNEEYAKFLLNRMAKEFIPIIQKRGYKVLAVSEMCCCTTALMAIQGGGREVWNSRSFHGQDPALMGCNRYVNHRATATVDESYCEIFIRLRQPNNHAKFRRFQEIDYTMCHELAHCEHQDHGIEFHRLMGEIQKEHSEVVQSAGEGHHSFENVEEQFGFNIYKSSNNGVVCPKNCNNFGGDANTNAPRAAFSEGLSSSWYRYCRWSRCGLYSCY